ncbi:MAG: toll/interleukin-1 receptor domain-containing protein, partial [Candidatus Zixiibacteriota bacterium]
TEWEQRIITELQECHIFVALLTKEFNGSDWTNQEAGIAISLSKTIIPLILSQKSPHGFLRKYQAEKLKVRNLRVNCKEIIASFIENPQFNDAFRNGLISKFGGSTGFIETHDSIDRILEFPGYTEIHLSAMENWIKKNDQISRAFNTDRVLKTFIDRERQNITKAS